LSERFCVSSEAVAGGADAAPPDALSPFTRKRKPRDGFRLCLLVVPCGRVVAAGRDARFSARPRGTASRRRRAV